MDNLYDSLFPGLKFSGAFLTPGLRAAFIVPLIQESEALQKTLAGGQLYVQIENGSRYITIADLSFSGDWFRVSITVRRANAHSLDMVRASVHFPPHMKLPKGLEIPSIFEGVGNEHYCVGVIDSCDPIPAP